MKKRTIFVVILLFLLSSGYAEDPTLTITVPVQLSQLHQDVTHFRVLVDCYAQDGTTRVATNNETIEIPTGNFQGEISLTMNPVQGQAITSARSYKCSLDIYVDGRWVDPNRPGIGDINVQAKENTTFVPEVTGSIEW